MLVSDFHFDLPEELIAQHPPAERGASRMLVLDRRAGGLGVGGLDAGGLDASGLRAAAFRDLPEFLRAGDLLILNDSRVLPARLFATRGGLGTQAGSPLPSGVIEVLLTEEVEGVRSDLDPTSQKRDPSASSGQVVGHPAGRCSVVWRALVKPARKVRVGETLHFRDAGGAVVLTAEVIGAAEFGERTLRFGPVEDFHERVGRIGHMPLPPYIRREQAAQPDTVEDRERYQTVYSHEPGSAAAPTAGLHFTPEVLAALKARGVEIQYLTLHVGLGTFQPVRVSELKDIRLHAERYTLPAATAEALNRARTEGRRVVAVGTTTTRTLEHIALRAEAGTDCHGEHVLGGEAQIDSASDLRGLKSRPISQPGRSEVLIPRSLRFEGHSGSTSIFIGPGYKFRVVGGLLTNFHLPESTLVMLVSAFAGDGGDSDAGRRMVLGAYEHAVREGYRFYSYGDCMLVV